MRRRGPRGGPVQLHRLQRASDHAWPEVGAQSRSTSSCRQPCPKVNRVGHERDSDCDQLSVVVVSGIATRTLLLANPGGLARERAEIEELRAAHTPATHYNDLGDHRAVERENALDADAIGNLADRERRADSATTACNADAFKGLEAFLVTFTDAHVDPERVAGAEGGDRLHPLFLCFDERVHREDPVEKSVSERTG